MVMGESANLNSKLPHGAHWHSWDGPEVVGGHDGALFGAAHTRHALCSRYRGELQILSSEGVWCVADSAVKVCGVWLTQQ